MLTAVHPLDDYAIVSVAGTARYNLSAATWLADRALFPDLRIINLAGSVLQMGEAILVQAQRWAESLQDPVRSPNLQLFWKVLVIDTLSILSHRRTTSLALRQITRIWGLHENIGDIIICSKRVRRQLQFTAWRHWLVIIGSKRSSSVAGRCF